MRLLVVEDSPSQAARLQSVLESEDYEVCVAVRGNQVLTMIEKEEPDLVILDLKLPDRDGFDLCRDIKAAAGDRFLPVIMLTVLGDVEENRFIIQARGQGRLFREQIARMAEKK